MNCRLQGYGHMGSGMHQLDNQGLGGEIDPLTGQLLADPSLATSMGLPPRTAGSGIIQGNVRICPLSSALASIECRKSGCIPYKFHDCEGRSRLSSKVSNFGAFQ